MSATTERCFGFRRIFLCGSGHDIVIIDVCGDTAVLWVVRIALPLGGDEWDAHSYFVDLDRGGSRGKPLKCTGLMVLFFGRGGVKVEFRQFATSPVSIGLISFVYGF